VSFSSAAADSRRLRGPFSGNPGDPAFACRYGYSYGPAETLGLGRGRSRLQSLGGTAAANQTQNRSHTEENGEEKSKMLSHKSLLVNLYYANLFQPVKKLSGVLELAQLLNTFLWM
jgi:hypothetical protein